MKVGNEDIDNDRLKCECGEQRKIDKSGSNCCTKCFCYLLCIVILFTILSVFACPYF